MQLAPALTTVPGPIQEAADVERVICSFAAETKGGIVVLPDVITVMHRKLIVSSSAGARLPAIYPFRDFTLEGGLVSYGIDLTDIYRRAATYVDRVLRGAAPNDLPVQAPVKFDLTINNLTINNKTARALGISLPALLLASADDLIE
jgi:putative ABC transport system substrate-binding protein